MPGKSEYLRVTEAAVFLGVSPNTIRNWGRDEKLPEYRHPVNNYRLYRKSDLSRLRRKLTHPPKFGRRLQARLVEQ